MRRSSGSSKGRRPALHLDDAAIGDLVIGLSAFLGRAYRRIDFTAIVYTRWRLVAKEHAIALLLPGHEQVRNLPGGIPR